MSHDDVRSRAIVRALADLRKAVDPTPPEQYGPHKQLEIQAWRWEIWASEIRDAWAEQTRRGHPIQWGLEERDVIDVGRCEAWARYRIDHANWSSKPENREALKAYYANPDRTGDPPGPRKPEFDDPGDVRGWRPNVGALNVDEFLVWCRKRWLQTNGGAQ